VPPWKQPRRKVQSHKIFRLVSEKRMCGKGERLDIWPRAVVRVMGVLTMHMNLKALVVTD